jgi:4-amino-4-deoxy-L-arabinose transferase-like glycosyltransferase
VALWHLCRRLPIGSVRRPWLLGTALFLGPWLPWYLVAEIHNPGFLQYFFVNENFLRYAASDYQDRYGGGHRFPYGAAIAFLVIAVLPWVLLLAWRLRDADRRRQALERLRDPALQFFAIAVAANVVFLCFSRHILGTYVLPVLPAAALVVASMLVSADFGVRRVARVSVALVMVYTLALTLGLPFIEDRWSARSVLDEARSIQRKRNATGQIIFIEKVPFSAHFYGGPDVSHLPWDAGNEHYEGYLVPAHGDLFVLNPTHGDRLDRYVMERLTKIADCGFYSIWEPTLPQESTAATTPTRKAG